MLLSTILKHYSITLIKFKPPLNLDLATCIPLFSIIFVCLGNLSSPQAWFFNHRWLHILLNAPKGPYFWILQFINHIQSLKPKASITVPLRSYNLPSYLITSQMIIICICNCSLTNTSIHRKLYLKLSSLRHSF